MRISARCDYACKALLQLAGHWPNPEPVRINAISSENNIPERYLVQILIQLKNLKLVMSSRGKEGGYTLAKAPARITLGEVIRSINGPILPRADNGGKAGSIFSSVWEELEAAMVKILDRITFEDIVKKVKGAKEAITYQI